MDCDAKVPLIVITLHLIGLDPVANSRLGHYLHVYAIIWSAQRVMTIRSVCTTIRICRSTSQLR